MKKFILSLCVMFSGVLLLCATLIAEGVRVAGCNASGVYYAAALFEQNSSDVSTAFLVVSLVIMAVGAFLSAKNAKE